MKKYGKNDPELRKSKATSRVNFEAVDNTINFFSLVLVPLLLLAYWIQFVADPLLIHHKQVPPFFIDTPYVKEFLNRPDGLAGFFSAFMFQFYEYGIIGTALEIALILATCFACLVSLNQFIKSRANYLVFLIAAFSILFHIDYRCDPFHPVANAICGFLSFILFVKIYLKNDRLSFVAFLVFCGFLTYFFTTGGLLLFLLSALFVLYRGNKKHLFILSPIYLVWIYSLVLRSGYQTQDIVCQGSTFGLIAEIVFILIAPVLVRTIFIAKRLSEKGLIQKFKFIEKSLRSPLFFASISLAVCLELFFLARHFFDINRKYLIQVDYLACNRQWERAIESFAKLKSFNNTAIVQLRRSLLHSGKLLDEFFSYPQLKEKFFFPDFNNDVTVCMPLAEFFYELGHINFAEHLAHESLEFDGAKSRQLLLLSKINLLKGRTNAALVFLHRLKQNPFHAKNASRLIHQIEQNEPFKEDEAFNLARVFMNTRPYAGYEVRDETFFNQLLVSNPKNRMAFECLIATLLANKNLAEAMRLLNAFVGFGFTNLPRHYEEAVLVWQVFEKHPEFVPGKYRLSPAALERFNEFVRVLENHKGNIVSAKPNLAIHFGTTFWFYYFYEDVFNPSLQYYKQE